MCPQGHTISTCGQRARARAARKIKRTPQGLQSRKKGVPHHAWTQVKSRSRRAVAHGGGRVRWLQANAQRPSKCADVRSDAVQREADVGWCSEAVQSGGGRLTTRQVTF